MDGFQQSGRSCLLGWAAISRREWLTTLSALGVAAAGTSSAADSVTVGPSDPIIELGTRRELFVDRFLIDELHQANLKLHEPRLVPPSAESADPMEYGTIIHDGAFFRLYTRDGRGAKFDGDVTEVTRYCESHDGINWVRPKLGLIELEGTKENNVILHEPWVCHNFSPFLDRRPGVDKEQRFKALAGVHKGGGLVAFVSADGIRWRRWREAPVITSSDFAFDSQNVSFWSEWEQCYVCYYRTWQTPHGNLRTISRRTSFDFLNWTPPVALQPNFSGEHLYTSQTHPYFRAPHIYISLPTRFHPGRGESTDILFMTARGAGPYDRTFREAFIRPGLDQGRWGNRSNYAALNVVPTSASEISIYVTPFRRMTLRTDGFASVHAGADLAEMRTKPLRFGGPFLSLNFATSAGGSIRVELQDSAGKALPGFSFDDCEDLVGDAIERTVFWRTGADLSALVRKAVRLRFLMRDADLFSMQFRSDL